MEEQDAGAGAVGDCVWAVFWFCLYDWLCVGTVHLYPFFEKTCSASLLRGPEQQQPGLYWAMKFGKL